MKKLVFIMFLSCSSLFAGSVRLINDSPYILRVVIRGNNGSFLGEMIINPSQATSWDSSSEIGYYGRGNIYQEQPSRAQTPYTVLWYCIEGADYSVCNLVATGATVTAQNCQGTRQCKPSKKQPNTFPHEPGERQFLDQEERREESTVGPPNY